MKNAHLSILAVCAALAGGCAATPPTELKDAREHYRRASTGPARSAAPAELHVAAAALAKAERAFDDGADAYRTRDLAYVAGRKAQLAEATASIALEKGKVAQARTDLSAAQGAIIERNKDDLSRAQTALEASEHSAALGAQELAAEQAARAEAMRQAAAAQAALAELAQVKEEARGLVITLSGSVLFASNQSALLPSAQARLDQVSDVLLTSRERRLDVEGHTDSQGSDGHNMELSQKRADAVRSYLVQRGYEADLVLAHGRAEGQPVADNGTAEGRANNRRVEIVVRNVEQATNQ